VQGAKEDADRLAEVLERLRKKTFDIHATLDSHHTIDIAHPIYWVDSNGNHPNPFTVISQQDVEDGVWRTYNPQWQDRSLIYVKDLAANGRYPLCIWPPHCIIGTWGWSITDPLIEQFLAWEKECFANVDKVTKGSNLWTEHYSAVQADVPDPIDKSTMLNDKLIGTLQEADLIPLSGQALSHCVANTVRDIANNFGEENIKKFVLLEDTTSPVPGFENLGQDFLAEMKGRGMQTCKAADFMV
jgi:nicotinamidase-related amidase